MRKIKKRVEAALRDIFLDLKKDGTLKDVPEEKLTSAARCEVSFDPSRGDFSSSASFPIAKLQKDISPKQLSEIVAKSAFNLLSDVASEIKAEGQGFINVRLSRQTHIDFLKKIHAAGADCGRGDIGANKKVQIEFVSANPTGPLSVAHGRQAAVGDSIARILKYTGYDVTREYFLNDTGNQINLLGRSIYVRLLELAGKESEFPEEGYQGDYIREIAQEIFKKDGKRLLELPPEKAASELAGTGANIILKGIKEDLARFRVEFDEWTSQAELESSGIVEKILSSLRDSGHTYNKDGAVWFKGTKFGDFQDRVLVKSDGSYTYRTPDIAYHSEKFARGFDTVIDLWGPDHHGHISSLSSGVKALGIDVKKLDLRIVQQCTLWKGKQKVKMSTRSGSFVTLREVMDEVGDDATRYFFLMRKMDSHLDFDLDLAKQRSLDNPVYYAQYAHARIAGITEYALKDQRFGESDFKDGLYCGGENHLDLLTEEDLKLVPVMARFPFEVESAARALDPQKITKFTHDLSAVFQRFYTMGKKDASLRVVTDDTKLTKARLYLVGTLGLVLRSALNLLGVSAPTSM